MNLIVEVIQAKQSKASYVFEDSHENVSIKYDLLVKAMSDKISTQVIHTRVGILYAIEKS